MCECSGNENLPISIDMYSYHYPNINISSIGQEYAYCWYFDCYETFAEQKEQLPTSQWKI